MKITIKDLSAFKELGNNGITFDVVDNDGNRLGDLRLGKGKIEWCKGRKHAGNGVEKTWQQLIAFFENEKA